MGFDDDGHGKRDVEGLMCPQVGNGGDTKRYGGGSCEDQSIYEDTRDRIVRSSHDRSRLGSVGPCGAERCQWDIHIAVGDGQEI